MNKMAKCALLMVAVLLSLTMSMTALAADEVAQVNGTKYAKLDSAIEAATDGSTVEMLSDVTITSTLTIDKKITLDLGGNTLTINYGWGGISAKGGCSIRNGQINYNGNVAAIRAWNVAVIEDLTIQVRAKDAGRITGGIVVQNNSANRIGLIKNTKITGATNGIETYECGNATEPVIGSMENVTIEATETGMLLSAPCGTATNCSIYGEKYGINMHLKGTYSVSLTLKDSDVVGGEVAVYLWDEESRDPSYFDNTGDIKLIVDSKTTFTSENGDAPIKSVIYDETKLDESAIFADTTDFCTAEINGVTYHYGNHIWETNVSDNSKVCVNCGDKIEQPTPAPEATPVPDTSAMPQTGDNSNIALFAALLTMSAAGMLLLMRRKSAER